MELENEFTNVTCSQRISTVGCTEIDVCHNVNSCMLFHVLMGHAYIAVISHSLYHVTISSEPSVPFWPPLLAEHFVVPAPSTRV